MAKRVSPLPTLPWGEGQGEGQPHAAAPASAPHPNPLPASGERAKTPKAIAAPLGGGKLDLPALKGDIVIVGAGLAGLLTALKLAPHPVTVVSPAPLGEGASSAWAQGGLAAAVGEGDSPAAHTADTIRAGAGIVDEEIARIVATEAADRVRDLLAYGVPFDRDPAGRFVLSREAAHSAQRILRVTGDRAGFAIMQALILAVRNTPSISVLEGYGALDLVVHGGRVSGVILERPDDPQGRYEISGARAVILATGGLGGLYAVTTNPRRARGDGMAIAARAGAVIADAEFVQFHPTAIDAGLDPAPLATEALRGEGAVLVDRTGRRFMPEVHADAELAPRDIVARAVFNEVAAARGAYLDCRTAIGAHFPEAFPTVYERCRSAGIDPVTQPIPVAPAAHYHMGGIRTDAHGRTSLPGLWAVGEVAATGLHGANRLASNSLLEAVVFGSRAAADVASTEPLSGSGTLRLKRVAIPHPADVTAREGSISQIRAIMSRDVGVVRDEAGLNDALGNLARIASAAHDDLAIENAALAAMLVADAARRRRESRGGHFRSDFPGADPAQQHHSATTMNDLKDRAVWPAGRLPAVARR